MGLFIVSNGYKLSIEKQEHDARIADVCNCNEDLERVLVIDLPDSTLYIPFDLGLSFLSMSSESEFLLVTPKYARPG